MSGRRFLEVVVGVFAILAVLVPSGPRPVMAAALDVTICAGPYALVDANKPGEEGPMVFTVCASVTNSSGGTVNNIDVYIGDGTTPGTFSLGSDSTTSLSLPGCASDAHRFIPSLANEDTQVVMWQLAYPPTFDVTYDFTVWAESQDGSWDGTDNHSITTRSSLTAAANKVLGTVTVDPPSGIVSAGNIIEVTSTGFNFGQVGDGYSGEQDAWLQPTGNLGFDPCCFRLVETEVFITSIDGTPEPPYYPMPYFNRLYFPYIKSQVPSPDPDYAFNSGDYVTYRFVALGDCSTVILPYQEVASGEVQKHSGDYGDDDATVTITSDGSAIELDKSVSPTTATNGQTLTWTIMYTNTSTLPVGDPQSGAALVIIDQRIPTGTTYVAGSADCTDYECIIFYSEDDGATWSTTEPDAANVTMIKWYINEEIPAGEDGTVFFETVVNDDSQPICNVATAEIDGAGVIAESTACANQLPDIEADKVDTWLDANTDEVVNPGESITYTVTITADCQADAEGVVYSDTLDPNVTLAAGTVITSQGSVTTGNTPGDSSVVVDVGTITACGDVTITYDVVVNDPLPEGVTHVTNQGLVTGNNFPSEPTNDPDTDPDDDPTIVPVTAAPDIEVLKTDSLYHDADSSGASSPGDTIEYEVVVTNTGNEAGTAAVLIDAMPDYTTLVVGSVSTTDGTTVEGNTPGDTMVEVDIGTLDGGGGTATITFRVLIDDVIPAEVDTISNQALVTGSNFPSEPSDDPDPGTLDDPTDTEITASPLLEVDKRDTPGPSAGGELNPGDQIVYTVTVGNSGNQEATSVVFSDNPDSNTTLVVGSVSTSQGIVVTGNTAGDTTVEISVGTVQVGEEVEISFTVEINTTGAFTQVANQGTASGGNFDNEPSDDPATPADDDPTVSPVVGETGAPLIEAYKTDSLVVDADTSGDLSVGDTIEYVVTITNSGTAPADAATFTDTPDANTSLVVGSVSTSLGSVTQGNTAGDSEVEVTIGTLNVGVTVTISFRVVLENGDYSLIANQGLVNWGAAAPMSEPTDDPDTDTGDDPTESPVSQYLPPHPSNISGRVERGWRRSLFSRQARHIDVVACSGCGHHGHCRPLRQA
ncbi:hypothetical protein ACFLUT_03740 [Chloroflexota bacterium]